MLTQERHLQILAQLEEKGTVSVAQLTQLLGASESTVRRDLIALDRLGKLHKVHGGATLTRRDLFAGRRSWTKSCSCTWTKKR